MLLREDRKEAEQIQPKSSSKICKEPNSLFQGEDELVDYVEKLVNIAISITLKNYLSLKLFEETQLILYSDWIIPWAS